MSLDNQFYQKLPALIDRVVMKMGRFQYAILLMLCYKFCSASISIVASTFHTYQPNFRCGQHDINQCEANGTCLEGYQFLGGDKTIVSEWSLVCSDRLLAPFVNTLYFVGPLFSVVVGSVSDWLGRKPTLLFCVYLEVICCIGLSFSTHLHWFIVLRMLQGFFTQGVFTIAFPLAMEYCSPKKRTLIALVFHFMWAIGLIYLGVIANAFRNWRDMQLFLAIPGLLTLAWSWLIPESIQWLCVKQQKRKALKLLVQFSKSNGNYNDIKEDHRYLAELIKTKPIEINQEDDINKQENSALSVWDIMSSIFKTQCLRKHLFMVCITWFIVSTSYYCILFYMPTLNSDRHVNFLISAVIEFNVYIPMYFLLMRYGRQIPMMTFLILNGISLGSVGVLTVYENALYLTISTIISRALSASLYYSIELYTTELFPTVNRTCAYGISGFAKQVGNILAPLLLPLSYEAPMVPLVVLGMISIIIGVNYVFIPETLNIQLPNTVEEAETIWGTKRSVS